MSPRLKRGKRRDNQPEQLPSPRAPQTSEWLIAPQSAKTQPDGEAETRGDLHEPKPAEARASTPESGPAAKRARQPDADSRQREIAEMHARMQEMERTMKRQALEIEQLQGLVETAQGLAERLSRRAGTAERPTPKGRGSDSVRSSAAKLTAEADRRFAQWVDEVDARVRRIEQRVEKSIRGMPGETTAAAGRRLARPAGEANMPYVNDRASRPSVDINKAGFEDLRKLGLSVTDSARLLASREVRSGFKSLDELDELDGLPDDVRAQLKQVVTV